jgi:ribosomal protein L24E
MSTPFFSRLWRSNVARTLQSSGTRRRGTNLPLRRLLQLESLEERTVPSGAPLAYPDSAVTEAPHPVQISVLANDFQFAGQTLAPGSVRVVSLPGHGTTAVSTKGVITYTPSASFTGTDAFQYTVRNTLGLLSNRATVSVVVERPVAADDWIDTDGTTPVAVDVLANDTAPAGSSSLLSSSVTLLHGPANGKAVVNSDGTITYTASAGFSGTDSFQYTVADSAGGVSLPGHVYVRINRPAAADEWTDTDGTTPLTLNVLANASDPDGNQHLVASSVAIVAQPAHGTAVANADGSITYTANGTFSGTDVLQYTISDDNGGVSLPAHFYVRVNRPTAADEWTDTDGTTPVTLNVLANASDPDGNQHLVASSVAITSQPAHGTAVANADGSITYSADGTFSGTDVLQYTISDDNGGVSLPAHFYVRVNRPTAGSTSVQTTAATPVTINVVKLSTDPDGNQHLVASSVDAVSPAANGAVVVHMDGTITYTPNSGFHGTDSFQYTISDDNGGVSLPATINVVVTQPWVSDGLTARTNGTTPVTISVLAGAPSSAHLVPSSVTLLSPPGHGSATINKMTGAITYKASTGFVGTDSFQFTVKDVHGTASAPVTVSVTVLGPTAADDWTDTDGTTPVSIDLLANDTDPRGNQHLLGGSLALVSKPAHGTVTLHANGTLTYTASSGFSGTDSFTYTVKNDMGVVSAPASVFVRINRPAAADEWIDTDGTTPVTLNVLANASDPDGNQHLLASSVKIVAQPAHGTAVVHSDGSITYTASAGFSGTDVLQYTIADDNGGVSLPAHFYIRINRPTAADEWIDTDGTTPVTLSVLANAADPDGNQHLVASSVTIVSPPAHGTAVANADGSITYTANGTFSGTDVLQYTIADDNGGVSMPAHFYIRVNRPTAADEWTDTDGTTPVTLRVIDNATDPDGNQHLVPSSVKIVNQPAHGAAVANADGSITYSANATFSGTDSFQYTIADDNGGVSLPASFFVRVNRPTAGSTFTQTPAGTPVTINVLTLSTDPDGNQHLVASSVAITSPAANGTAISNGDGTITYTPNSGFHGTDSFQYTIGDNNGGVSLPATVNVSVTQSGALNGSGAQTFGTAPVTINELAGFTGTVGSSTLVPSSVTLVSQPAHGSVSINPTNGAITYRANAGFVGLDAFQFTVKDNHGTTYGPATVSVVVLGPTAADDWTDTDGTTPVSIDVLANDTDPRGNQHLLATGVIVVSQPGHGTAIVNADGSVTYTASAGFSGTDSFRYTVKDDMGAVSAPASVFVRINRPTAADEWIDTDGTTPVTLSVLDNAADPDGNQHLVASSVKIVSLPAHGIAVANTDGSITYTASAGFSGTDVLQYTIADDNGGVSLPASFFVRVNRPTAADEWTDTDGTTPVTLSVLANATDPDGNQHLVASSIVILGQPAHGTAVANPDGTITYTANGTFSGTDSFQYTIADDNAGVSLPASFFVRVNRPTAADEWTDTDGTTPVTLSVLANASDPDGNQHLVASSVKIVNQPAHGAAVANADGSITYTAKGTFSGTDSFQYTISDDNGGVSLPASFFVRVNRPNAGSTSAQTTVATPVTINVLTLSTDPDGNQHLVASSVAVAGQPANGTAVANANGTITYTPNSGFHGTDSFQYTISDDNGGVSLPATVNVVVTQPWVSDGLTARTNGTTPVTISVLAGAPTSAHLVLSSVKVVSPPGHGSASVNPMTGAITYRAAAGFVGMDSFQFTAKDVHGTASAPVTVSVVVLGPTAADDWTDTDGTTPVTLNVLTNDTDPRGNQHLLAGSLMLVSKPAHGTVTLHANGTLTYTASAGFSGTDSFTYTVKNDLGAVTAPASVFVRINRPTAADEWIDTDGTTPVTLNVLANAADPDGNQHLVASSVKIVSLPAHGAAVVHSDGSITYTASPGFSGTDVLQYTIADDNGGVSLPASFFVRINRPTAADEWTDTDGTTPVSINVLANAADPDGNQHLVASSVKIVGQPAHGTAVANPDGTITYTANSTFSGTDSFQYTIADDNGGVSLPATAFVRVNRPTAGNVVAQADGTVPVTINVFGQSTDPDGNQHLVASSVKIVSQPAHGLAVANADGTVTYTANAGYSGPDSFQYTIADDNGGVSLPGTVSVNTALPTVRNATYSFGSTPLTINLQDNVSDPLGPAIFNGGSVNILSGPAHGQVTTSPGSLQITYTPAAGFIGVVTIEYSVTDADGVTSKPATLTLIRRA